MFFPRNFWKKKLSVITKIHVQNKFNLNCFTRLEYSTHTTERHHSENQSSDAGDLIIYPLKTPHKCVDPSHNFRYISYM